MHVREIRFKRFKRFTDLTITGLQGNERLVVITGPNGSGKSAIIDGFNAWRRQLGGWAISYEQPYFTKKLDESDPTYASQSHASLAIEFFEDTPLEQSDRRRLVYVRSAYRHEAEFRSSGIVNAPALLDDPGEDRLNRAEQKVQQKYGRLVGRSVTDLFSDAYQQTTPAEITDRLVGKVRKVIRDVFEDLYLVSIGDPLSGGTFLFTKGTSLDWS